MDPDPILYNPTHSPIALLPPELLVYIFSMMKPQVWTLAASKAYERYPVSPLLYEAGEERSWHPIYCAAVCRYWRQLTLACPLIWSDVNAGYRELQEHTNADLRLARICLRRSSDCPIDVFIWDESDEVVEWASQELVHAISRFRSFYLHGIHTNENIVTFLKHLTQQPAPVLRTLQMSPRCSNPLRLPKLFAGHIPQLRHLHLSHVSSWDGNDFHNLRTLVLVKSCQATRAATVLGLLECSPELQTLVMENCAPRDDHEILSAPRIDCPQLRHITLYRVPPTFACNLLTRLETSPTISLSLSIAVAEDSDNPSIPAPIFSTAAQLDAIRSTTRLCFTCNIQGIGFSGSGSSSFNVTALAPDNPWVTLAQGISMTVQFMAMTSVILGACPNADEVWIENVHPSAGLQTTEAHQLARVLQNSHIKKLVLLGVDEQARLLLISLQHVLADPTSPSMPLCPSLEELHIHVSGIHPHTTEVMMAALRKFMVLREACGHPVRLVNVVRYTYVNVPHPGIRPSHVTQALHDMTLYSDSLPQPFSGTIQIQNVQELPKFHI